MISNLATSILAFPRLVKRFVVIMLDMSLCVFTMWLA
jgi:hypothetical protein